MIFEKVAKRAEELGINYLVVASNTGKTALELYKEASNKKIICVTHHVGFTGPGIDEMGKPMREKLQQLGIEVYTATHLMAGIDRSVRKQFGGLYPGEIVANTLRLFGQGVKVGVEIAVMALDAGLIPYGEDVIAIGGTSNGADSAIVVRPAHSNEFFATRIEEIIAKSPRER